MLCELCNNPFGVLTPTEFKGMIWKQGKSFEEIGNNKIIEKTKIDLCSDCRKRLFSNSKITITFSKELLHALTCQDSPEAFVEYKNKQLELENKFREVAPCK